MFTGLVQALGSVKTIEPRGPDRRIVFRANALPLAELTPGESIAINGACLTVAEKDVQGFSADISAETLRCTNLGQLKAGDSVNLERCLTLQSLIGGHLVSGHVDAVGTLKYMNRVGECTEMSFVLPAELARYVAAKGSVCVDGVSLTVNQVGDDNFEVNLIPHTLKHTIAGLYQPGQIVNIEIDLIARYAERLLSTSPSTRSS